MRGRYENVRPLICRPAGHAHSYRYPAKVIPLHPRLHGPQLWRTVGSLLLTIAMLITLAAAIPLALRSARDVAGSFILAWPHW